MDSINEILLSQQMLDAIKHIIDNIFFLSGRQRTGVLCVQHSPTATALSTTAFEWKMQFLCFPILLGSAEAQVIWCGIVKHLLIAYFISDVAAKEIPKSIHVCQSYSKPKVDRFFWDTV